MWRPVLDNIDWMSWNLMLALVPATLAISLFRRDRQPGLAWWAGLAALVVFLPNAPYVLTDVVHLPGQLRQLQGHSLQTGVLLGQYAALFALGFAAYGFTVISAERRPGDRGRPRGRLLVLDVGIHVTCALGVFLGRVWRFNSWTLLDEPDDVLRVVSNGLRDPQPRTVAAVLLATAAFAVGTMVLRAMTVAGRRALI